MNEIKRVLREYVIGRYGDASTANYKQLFLAFAAPADGYMDEPYLYAKPIAGFLYSLSACPPSGLTSGPDCENAAYKMVEAFTKSWDPVANDWMDAADKQRVTWAQFRTHLHLPPEEVVSADASSPTAPAPEGGVFLVAPGVIAPKPPPPGFLVTHASEHHWWTLTWRARYVPAFRKKGLDFLRTGTGGEDRGYTYRDDNGESWTYQEKEGSYATTFYRAVTSAYGGVETRWHEVGDLVSKPHENVNAEIDMLAATLGAAGEAVSAATKKKATVKPVSSSKDASGGGGGAVTTSTDTTPPTTSTLGLVLTSVLVGSAIIFFLTVQV